MSSVLVLVDEVLYSLGNTLHLYPLAFQLCTVEDSIHKKNQLPVAFFLEDQGSFSPYMEFLDINFQVYNVNCVFTVVECREHGVVGDMRDAWPSARVRKNVSLIRTYHGFKGTILMLSTLGKWILCSRHIV